MRLYRFDNVEIVDRPESFSQAALDAIARHGFSPSMVRGFYDSASDTVYFNAARLSPSEVPGVVFHELVAHKGLREVLAPDAFHSMLDWVSSRHGGEARFREIAERYHLDLETENGRREAAEEYIAHLAEERNEALKPSWWREFLAQVKQLLRRLPYLDRVRWSDREIEALLRRSARAMRRRNRAGSNRDAGMFFAVNENGETLFHITGRDNAMTAQEIIDDPTISPKDFVLTSEGSEIWGEITPEMVEKAGEKSGIKALPIKLQKGRHRGHHSGFGLAHLYTQHGKELEGKHYDLSALLTRIFGKPYQVYASSARGNIRLEMVTRNRPREIGVLELQEENGFYSVITAFTRELDHYELRGKEVWRYTGSTPNKISQEGSSVISASKQRTGPLDPLSAENTADTARTTRPKPDNNINDSQEKSSLSDDSSHFSIVDERERENSVRFSVAPVWTGSAASYDAPSLQYIGTGEGAQVYGWGLYGSSSRNVGEWYARQDVKRKNRERILLDGKEPDLESMDKLERNVLLDILLRKGSISGTLEYYRLELKKPRNPHFYDDSAEIRSQMQWLEKNQSRIQYIPENESVSGRRNLYRQTFWPGKEENLLDWDNPVPENQRRKIEEQLKTEGLFVDGDPDKASEEYRALITRKKAGESVSAEELSVAYEKAAHLHAQRNVIGTTINGDIPSGSMVYENLEDILGSPKAVSEFLYRAGIDGVTFIGGSSGVRNYVAFSDKDILVDEHIRFSESGQAEELANLMAKRVAPIIRDANGRDSDVREEVRTLLSQEGFELSDAELEEIIKRAQQQVRRFRSLQRLTEENDYIRATDPWIATLQDVYSTNFKISTAGKYATEDFSGTWIGKDGGVAPDEAARTLSAAFGQEITDDDVVDHFRYLKRRDILAKRREENRAMEEALREEERLHDMELAEQILAGEFPFDDEFIGANPRVAKMVRDMVSPAKPGEPRADWATVRAALGQENPQEFAKGYFEGREAGRQEYRERLREARKNTTDIRTLQEVATREVRRVLPEELQGAFLKRIADLGKFRPFMRTGNCGSPPTPGPDRAA